MKRKFIIGQLVTVELENQVEPGYIEGHRLIRRKVEWANGGYCPSGLETGVITGMKQFWEGTYTPETRAGSTHFGYEQEYEQACCTQDNQVVVWCVRLGYLNKELYFFEKDVHPSEEAQISSIPKKWIGINWTPELRKAVSRDSKTWPRDSQGRFCK